MFLRTVQWLCRKISHCSDLLSEKKVVLHCLAVNLVFKTRDNWDDATTNTRRMWRWQIQWNQPFRLAQPFHLPAIICKIESASCLCAQSPWPSPRGTKHSQAGLHCTCLQPSRLEQTRITMHLPFNYDTSMSDQSLLVQAMSFKNVHHRAFILMHGTAQVNECYVQ